MLIELKDLSDKPMYVNPANVEAIVPTAYGAIIMLISGNTLTSSDNPTEIYHLIDEAYHNSREG